MRQSNKKTICHYCGKVGKMPIKQEPNRHATSPNSINSMIKEEKDKYYEYLCSEECRQAINNERYAFYADLDRNASDSECFEHLDWISFGGVKHRLGYCNITGEIVVVEPMMPGDNSGQPKECYEHFVLHERYRRKSNG